MVYLISHAQTKKSSIHHRLEYHVEADEYLKLYLNRKLTSDEMSIVPSVLWVGKSRLGSRLPDMIGTYMGNWCVSEIFYKKINELEPDLHEFFPIKIRREKEITQDVYYLMRITENIEAIDYEHTVFLDKGVGRDAAERNMYDLRLQTDRNGKCFVKKNMIENKHLWRWGGETGRNYFCSTEIYDFCKENKLVGWSFHECVVVYLVIIDLQY